MSRSTGSKKNMEDFDPDDDEDDDEVMSPSQKASTSSPTFRRTAMEVIRKQEHAHFRMEGITNNSTLRQPRLHLRYITLPNPILTLR